MNKTKNRVSNLIMILILLFLALRQIALYQTIEIFNASNSIVSDITFIVLISLITLIVSFFVIYLPVLFVVNISVKIPVLKLELPYLKEGLYTYLRLFDNRHRYQHCQVFRC